MHALILDGSDPAIAVLDGPRRMLTGLLTSAGWTVTHLPLAQMEIPPCCGSFACWVRTPGECASGAACQRIGAEMMAADLLVLLSPVVFGGYSAELKKALDHLIPNISPFMTRIDGETRHHKRYEQYPSLLGVGWQPQPDPDAAGLFCRLFGRNALNLFPPNHAVSVLNGLQSEVEQQLELAELLQAVAVQP